MNHRNDNAGADDRIEGSAASRALHHPFFFIRHELCPAASAVPVTRVPQGELFSGHAGKRPISWFCAPEGPVLLKAKSLLKKNLRNLLRLDHHEIILLIINPEEIDELCVRSIKIFRFRIRKNSVFIHPEQCQRSIVHQRRFITGRLLVLILDVKFSGCNILNHFSLSFSCFHRIRCETSFRIFSMRFLCLHWFRHEASLYFLSLASSAHTKHPSIFLCLHCFRRGTSFQYLLSQSGSKPR